ncbi:D-Ala-D-Ala carboxypeptidase family metallohydrolase [Oricola cellulosilytica]|uniref:D-Ala-D-Ala carboxypeptidase family metallohydrolase n=1 Tax=Oricola cellulosilytica TaxID=1429082 RepID=UPI001CBFC84C|nr:YcbK family protein [Oricola cellulosilytica]
MAATALSGCVASALDSAATFDEADSGGFALASNETSAVPRPANDLVAEAEEIAESDYNGSDPSTPSALVATPSAGSTEPLVDSDATANALIAIEGTSSAQAEMTMAAIGSVQESDEHPITDLEENLETASIGVSDSATDAPPDPATARIDAASGVLPARQPPVASKITTVTDEKRPGGLLSLFGNNRSGAARAAPRPKAAVTDSEPRRAGVTAPRTETASPRPVVAVASAGGTKDALPGVDRERALGFGLNGSPAPSASLIDAGTPFRVASAAGLARLAPNGLGVQNEGVDVKCLKPALVRVLKQIEGHYGRRVVVTSGFRSPSRNKRARGAKNSLHMYCSAADIQVEDVSKWELAEFVRSMPGRGGVGTYCHTESVHVDVGPQRDWNWRCRRRK